MNMPTTQNQDILEWCIVYNIRNDFMKDPTISIEVMNLLMLKMWNIEDRNPNWNIEIRPILKPYFHKK